MSRARLRIRFSIAGLMGLVLFTAVAIAALEHASVQWASLLTSLTLFLLATALLGAIYRRGPKRAFWTGFFLVGGSYLILALAPWFANEVRPWLVTTRLLDHLYPHLQTREPVRNRTSFIDNEFDVIVVNQSRRGNTQAVSPQARTWAFLNFNSLGLEPFQRVGHCLLTLLFAYLGALTARHLDARPVNRNSGALHPEETHRPAGSGVQ